MAYLGLYSQNESYTDSYANIDLTIAVDYSVPPSNVSITADNNFTAPNGSHGSIQVDNVQHDNILSSGYTFSKNTGENLTLGAVEPQQDNQNHQMVWYTGSVNKSDWRRSGEFRSNNNPYSFTLTSDDNNKTYKANLRKNYAISRNDATEFDGTVSAGVVTHIVEGNSGSVPADPTKTVGSRMYNFVGWDNGANGVFAPIDNSTYPNSALYKMQNKSNDAAAFSNNSQRKFIYAGYFYKVYTSMNNVWLEKSTDCINWSIVGNAPVNNLSEGPEAKNPSIDFSNDIYSNYYIYVTYQQKTNDGKYKIKLVKFNQSDSKIFSYDVETSLNNYSSEDAAPVISVSAYGTPKMIIVWKENSNANLTGGLYYRCAKDYTYYINWEYAVQKVSWTSNSNSNPTIDVIKDNVGNNTIYFHLAYQYLNTKIKYCKFVWGTSGVSLSGYEEEPSLGTGISLNYKPSISVVNLDANGNYIYDSPKLTWLASFGGQDYFAMFRDKPNSNGSSWNSYHGYYSPEYEVNYININKNLDDGFAFVYSFGTYNNYVKGSNLSVVQSLSSHVRDIQISNSMGSWDEMYVLAYNNTTSPFNFSKAGEILSKSNFIAGTEGRGCAVRKNNAEFYCSLGDVYIDGDVVSFKEKDDTIQTKSNSALNDFLVTKPFSVNNNSHIYYSINYRMKDSLESYNILSSDNFINFEVELIDYKSGDVLGTLNKVKQTKNMLQNNLSNQYDVNLTGIGNREVVLKLVETDNLKGEYTIGKIYNLENGLKKKGSEKISLNHDFTVKEYELGQNYPNPFNPTTTISYQLPKDGIVTLKVYDMLGREVATLVNDKLKTPGRYSVNFNASSLASGVYIYQLKVNDHAGGNGYTATKKLMLLK